jgi:hypothetical protein
VILGVLLLSSVFSISAYASSSVKNTENFVPDLTSSNVKCNAEDFNMTVNPSTPPKEGSFPSGTFAFCTFQPYTGPTLSVSSVTITLYAVNDGCGSSCTVSGSLVNMGSTGSCTTCGSVYSFTGKATNLGSGAERCSNALATTITLKSGLSDLVSGDYYQATFAVSSGEILLCSGDSVESLIAVTGSQQTSVPQFPLGLIAILGITMPALILLKARFSVIKKAN